MLKTLTIKDFTVFSDVTLEFSEGLNVIVGENGTGKTHVLKLAYLFGRAWSDLNAKRLAVTPERAQAYLAERLAGLFQVPDLESLARRGSKGNVALQARVNGHIPTVQIRMPSDPPFMTPGLPEPMSWDVRIQRGERGALIVKVAPEAAARNAFMPSQVYVPSKEMVSLFKGLIGLFEKYREVPLDETYRDLAVAMATLEPRETPPLLGEVQMHIQTLLGGDLKLEKGELVFERREGGRVEISLLAEGYRKLAMLIYLMRYGVVERGSTLFWDEPEANLNPAALKLLAEALYALAGSGVQVIAATHSLFLLREFEILQMRDRTHGARVDRARNRYFALGQDRNRPVQVTQGDDIVSIEPLALLDENLLQSDRYMEVAR